MIKTILGIRRSPAFSPNHTGNDSKIFSLTVQELEKKGCKVRQMTEEEFFHEENIQEEIIFSMVRHPENTNKLKHLDKEGRKIINSGHGIWNCFRANMTELLIQHNIPQPKSIIVSTLAHSREVFEELGNKGIWIKRGDFHTVHKEDIAFCRNYAEAASILKEYAVRGIPNVVLSEHLSGDLVKFYAVKGTPFFHWFYPFDTDHMMMGAKDTGSTNYFSFDIDELKILAEKAVNALDIHIYGGDAIISSEGEIRIIDVNDWPSFAPCRNEAAKYIAEIISA